MRIVLGIALLNAAFAGWAVAQSLPLVKLPAKPPTAKVVSATTSFCLVEVAPR